MAVTPGPWRYEQNARGDRSIRSADGSVIFCDTQYYPWCSDNEADWPLVAAAPDLLAALKRIAFEPFGPSDASHAEVLRDIEAFAKEAIAKAEGK